MSLENILWCNSVLIKCIPVVHTALSFTKTRVPVRPDWRSAENSDISTGSIHRMSQKTFFGQIWFKIFKVLCLNWNSARKCIQRCSFWIVFLIVFLNSVAKTPFLGKLAPETSKCFVLNETRYVSVVKGVHSEFNNYFLRFRSQNTYSGQNLSRNVKVLCFK